MSTWTTDDIGDLTGQRWVVTGVTGGLGTEIVRELAEHGAAITATARNAAKADATVSRLRADVPDIDIEVVELDLADLDSAKRAAGQVVDSHERIDGLVNNAGIMATPWNLTPDGFELQIATNHLGHFAWTGRLWPVLDASDARVVSVASLAHTMVKGIDLRSLTPDGAPRRYQRWQSYGESKLANLLFALELDRRASAVGSRVISTAAHPGFAATELTKTGWATGRGRSGPLGALMHGATRIVAQSAHAGALPILQAATDPGLTGGEYLGPQGYRGIRGRPGPAAMTRAARDSGLAERLWAASEAATGEIFSLA